MTRTAFLVPATLLVLASLLAAGCGNNAASSPGATATTPDAIGKQHAANMQKQFQKMHGGTH